MADDNLGAYLGTVPLLRGLPAPDIARLARKAPAPRVMRPGGRDAEPAVIYAEGDPSTALYLLLDEAGDESSRPIVQVSVEDDKLTTRVRLWRVYPRNYFGDFEFLAESETGRFPPRMTKAVPLTPCRVLELPFTLLNEFIDEHPIILRRLVRESMARFQQTLEETLAEKVSDPDIALANWLVERARDFGIREGNHVRFRTAISQEAIGKDLGVSRETISLRLNEWRRRGLMTSARGSQFAVRDMERVERIAALALERSRDEHHAAVESVDAALARGDNFRARNFALDVLNYFPGSAELKHRAALAIARCGATQEALGLLERFGFGREVSPERIDQLVRSGVANPAAAAKSRMDDFDVEELNEQIAAAGEKDKVATLIEDILALAPRLWKDLAFQGEKLDKKAAREAYDGYCRAFEASGRPYTGVNAASLAVMLGLPQEAQALTEKVVKRLSRRNNNYWDFVTKAEALLLRGDKGPAEDAFRASLGCDDAYEGSIAATRLQLSRLANAGVPHAAEMLAALPNRTVAVFTGAIMGRDLAPAAQAKASEALASAVSRLIDERGIGHIYGDLRAGADIVIAEAALAKGVRLHVVLPGPVDDFVAAFVAPADPPASERAKSPAPSWRERFERCLAQAASLTLLSQKTPPARENAIAAAFALRHAAGQAIAQSRALLASCMLVTAGDDDAIAALAQNAKAFEAAPLPATWDAATPTPVNIAGSSWRPVVFAWLLGAEGSEGQLSARGVSEAAIDAGETIVKKAAGKDAFVLRRVLGGNRPQAAIVAIPRDIAAAVSIAEALRHAKWPPGVSAQITLDHGPVLGTNGAPNDDRLKDLDAGNGPLETPPGTLVASAPFVMEAHLSLGDAVTATALGRVARLESSSSPIQLLPSTEIYALQPRS